MLFTRLARTIIRHNKAVFVIWLVALALSVPAVLNVQSVIVYNETAFNPKNSESSVAQAIVSREFSINQGNSIVVVITSNDVRGSQVRDFALAFNRTLHNDPKLSSLSNITSIYDIYYQLLLGYTSVVHLELYQVRNTTSLATSIEFGIPSVYVNQWNTLIINSGLPSFNQTQLAAYNRQAYNMSWPIVMAQTPPAYQTVAFNYLLLFYQSWNRTFTAPSYLQYPLVVNAFARAQNVTKGSPLIPIQPSYYNITLPFVNSLPLNAQTMSLFLASARFFNLYSPGTGGGCLNNNCWNDMNALRSFTINWVAQGSMANSIQLTIIGQIYDLGGSATSSDLSSLAQQILRNYNLLTYPVQASKNVYSQFVSARNGTMLVIIDFKTNGPDPRNSVKEIRDDVGIASIQSNQSPVVYVTGEPAFNYDIETESVGDVERIDPITVVLILVIIGVFFASIAAPLIPISAIGLSVGIAFGLVYFVGAFITNVHFLVLTLLPVAMLGAGSDYCIFLVSRYAEERRLGRGKKDAVERAVTWAGESIATSGATVIIAFASLSIASFGLLRSIGLAVMLGISVALLVALTLVPAMLSVFGDRIFWPGGLGLWKKRNKDSRNSYYARAARFTAKHSKLILLVALAVSLPATSTVLASKTSHDLIAQIPSSLESKAGYTSMSQGFGPGTITPTYTIIQTRSVLVTDTWINVTALTAFSYAENSTLSIAGVSKVYGLTHPAGDPIAYSNFNRLNVAEQEAMIRSMKPFLGSDDKSGMVWANLANEPYSDAAIATLGRIRDNVSVLKTQNPLLASSTMLVGGATADVADLASAGAADYFNMTALVIAGVFVVLLAALGSVFTPLRLIFTILLSISWAMALVIYVFQSYFGTELIWIMPIMLLVMMVGLGLDYDIFLVTRIREYVVGGAKDEEAIETAVERTGGIITVSGLVTAGAFGTLMISQIPMLQQLGLGIFIVVLLDATLTRIYLVPSIMMIMKRLNWWAPGPLRRMPVTPEEKLIPPIPLKTKISVTVETLMILGLGIALYLDYANNPYLQTYVTRTESTLLAGINVWTGVILGVTSFLVTYILLQGKFRTSGPSKPKSFNSLGQKLHLRGPGIIGTTTPLSSVPSSLTTAVGETDRQSPPREKKQDP